jgi:hypothetical protein
MPPWRRTLIIFLRLVALFFAGGLAGVDVDRFLGGICDVPPEKKKHMMKLEEGARLMPRLMERVAPVLIKN